MKFFKPYKEFISKPLSPSLPNIYGPQYIKINNINTEHCVLLDNDWDINRKPKLYDYIEEVIEGVKDIEIDEDNNEMYPDNNLKYYDSCGLISYHTLIHLIDDIETIKKLLNSDKKNKDYSKVVMYFNFNEVYITPKDEHPVFSITNSYDEHNYHIYLSIKDLDYFIEILKEILDYVDEIKKENSIK